jgi:SNF2 family DNA or RNA helicase
MTNFYQVNGEEIDVLYALALFEAPLHQASMLELLRIESHLANKNTKSKIALDINFVRDAFSNLFELGYLDFKSGQGFCLKPDMQMAICIHLKHNTDTHIWVKSIRQLLNNHSEYQNWKAHNVAFCRREMLLSALDDDIDGFLDWRSKFFLTQYENSNNLGNIFFSSDNGKELFSLISLIIQTTLLSDIFHDANWFLNDCKEVYEYAKNNFKTLAINFSEFVDSFSLQTLLRGDYEQLLLILDKVPKENTYHLQSIYAAQQGDFISALQSMNAYTALIKKQTGKRKIYIPDIVGLFYLLIILVSKDEKQTLFAKEQLDEGIKQNGANSYVLFRPLVHHLAMGIPLDDRQYPISIDHNLDALFQGLALLWSDKQAPDTIKNLLLSVQSLALQNDYEWLQAELEVFQKLLNQVPDKLQNQDASIVSITSAFHQSKGLIPLAQAYTSSASWEVALNALSQLSQHHRQEKTSVPKQQKMRLAWHVELANAVLRMEPREQKQNDKGVWSKGRAISLKRLLHEQESLPYLTEQDKRIATYITHQNDYLGAGQYALQYEKSAISLIAHPAVFWIDSPDVASDVALDIKKGEIALQLKEENQQISLQLVPAFNMFDASTETFTLQETHTRLTVYSINKEIKKIASILGSGLTVPLEAKEQLVDVIAAIAPHLEIHSDLSGFSSHMKSIDANTMIYAHLLPLKDGLRLQMLVKPLENGAWFSPGKGLESIFDERDGVAIQVTRQLEQEQTQYTAILNACSVFKELENDVNHNNNEWQINEPETCLELLTQLKNIAEDKLQLVWPEGEKFRIKGQSSSQALRLNIKKQGDWFVANGDFQLDDDRIIGLRELMQLASQSKGKFLKIGDDEYIALTENLRQRLTELNNIGEATGKSGVKINVLASTMLADLALEADEIKADQAWHEHVQKIDELEHFVPAVPSTLQADLRDYQVEGFQWLARLAHWGVGACLADDMGLGKTLQTLALLLSRASNGPALVIAPSSVVMNWQAEIMRFAPTLKIHAYHQSRSLQNLTAYDVVIASYGLLQQDSELFIGQHWHSLVLDEAQLIKNAGTKRSQTAMALQADFKMIISGTPVENHLGELWNLFRFINPSLLGSREKFLSKFITPLERGDKVVQVQLKTQLKKLIQAFILRRTKTQVLSELPSRTEITLQVELSDEERHLYEALRQEAIDKIEQSDTHNGKTMQILAELTKLRRFCCHPQLVLKNAKTISSKLTLFKQTIDELLDNKHKVLVFSQFVDHLHIVRDYLDAQGIAYQYLDGSTAMADRAKRVDAFQSGQGDVFLISLKAGGTGLNLTAADYVIHLDPWWNPAVEDQASDRAHRMGQKRPVTIYRLVTQNTIEEQIISLHQKKRNLAEDLLEGGGEVGRMHSEDLIRLLKSSL